MDVRAREKLEEALSYVREGDTLVVTKLDRLARSMAHLMEIRQRLEERGTHLRIIDLNLDTTTPTGKLMLNLLGSVAEFEREIMLERQREGIAKAKEAGKYKGRAPTARAKADEVVALKQAGVRPTDIAKRLGIVGHQCTAFWQQHRCPAATKHDLHLLLRSIEQSTSEEDLPTLGADPLGGTGGNQTIGLDKWPRKSKVIFRFSSSYLLL